jgi:hypothetical protein
MINEDNDLKDIKDKDFEVPEVPKQERRNSKRFDERLSAKLEDENCSVLNVSNKGVLLQTRMPLYFFPLDKIIDFELRLQEQWIRIKGRVMWIQSDALHSKIGLFIQHAPEPYFEFLRELYE